MDAVLDKALALRGVIGVLVLTRDSWLTIASRGALNASDAPTIERLLSWMDESDEYGIDSSGSIPWMGGEGGRCIHFHRAETHTLILLRQHQPKSQDPRIPIPNLTDTTTKHSNPDYLQVGPLSASPKTPSTGGGGFVSSLHAGLSGLSFSPRFGSAPRMRFGWSRSSTESRFTNATNADSDAGTPGVNVNGVNGVGLRAGSASLFAPSRSVESHGNVHRPSSWC